MSMTVPLTLEFQEMPLAVYRELQAHLEQLEGLTTELIPQTTSEFSYSRSQIGGIRLNTLPQILDLHRLIPILAYYHRIYPLTNPKAIPLESTSDKH
jgi:hypothetical protein